VDTENPELSNGARYQDLTSTYLEYALESYFGKLDYNFNEKYYLTASIRTDGSSRFHPDAAWGQFWAVGGSWRISQETFMSGISFVNDLKLKASYGTQGNDNLLDNDANRSKIWYAYKNLYAVNSVDGEPSVALKFRGSPDLTWEKSANFNVGLELVGWNNRLSLSAEYFIKDTKDLLYARPLAASDGAPNYKWVNDLDMRNTGIEVEAAVDVVKTSDFKLNINLNATHYKNALTRLPSDKPEDGYMAGIYWREKGGSIYDYYLYDYRGVDPETGLAQYAKVDDAGVETLVNTTTEATRVKTGKSPIPDLYGGLGATLTGWGFDLSVQTAYQIGGYVLDNVYQGLMDAGRGGNFHKDVLARWTPETPNTDVPKMIYEDQNQAAGNTTRWLTSASYFSIRNITLGYTLPKKWSQVVKMDKVRIYAVADNVFYTSKRQGLDVRQSFDGDMTYAYSLLRTVSLGLSLGF
jgi:hypothetical protein